LETPRKGPIRRASAPPRAEAQSRGKDLNPPNRNAAPQASTRWANRGALALELGQAAPIAVADSTERATGLASIVFAALGDRAGGTRFGGPIMPLALDPVRSASILGVQCSCSSVEPRDRACVTYHHRGGSGPVFIPCRHLDSPNRAGRLPIPPQCVRANA